MDNAILEQITAIAHQYSIFQCIACAEAIKAFLCEQGITGKRVRLDLGFRDLPWAVIYDLKRGQQIAMNGYHEGIALVIDGQEMIFDNLDPEGVPRMEWMQNLTSPTIEMGRGNFIVIEEVF